MRVWTRILGFGGQRWKAMALALALVGALLAGLACGGGATQTAPAPAEEAPTAKPTIRLADNQYESLWINDAIAKFIIENGYGYPVETVELTTVLVQVALAKGDADVWVEMWKEYFIDWYNKETAAGNIIDLTEVVMFEGPAFFMISTWMAEQYNIRTIEDMKRPEVVALFPDPEDATKGLFVNCVLGSQCSQINPAKLRAYGLDQYYNTIEAGSQGAIDAAFAGAMKRQGPVFGYYWAPTSIVGSYDWYFLEEPPYTDECWKEVAKGQADKNYTPKQACAYATSQVTIAIHKGMLTKAPDVVELLKKMSVGTAPLSRTAAWANENSVTDWEKAALYYLRTYEDRWTTWMPADKAQKVKEALAKVN
jgi:glycine betaine/proline transport system substrate-binding protein